jgi:hypothetical protein
MTWATRRVTRPLVVEPERDSLIGSIWTRREITDPTDIWNEVRLTGLFDLGNDQGGVECCVTPVSFGPTVTTTAEGLTEAYTRKENATERDRLTDVLRRAAAL